MNNGRPELLKDLADDEATRVLALGTPMRLSSGALLFGLGSAADSIYLIRQGRIALTLPIHVAGKEEAILVEERTPGQAVGWSGLIPPHRYTLTARALLESEVLAVRRHDLLALFAEHPATGCVLLANVAAIVSQRLQVFQAMWLREIQRVVERSA